MFVMAVGKLQLNLLQRSWTLNELWQVSSGKWALDCSGISIHSLFISIHHGSTRKPFSCIFHPVFSCGLLVNGRTPFFVSKKVELPPDVPSGSRTPNESPAARCVSNPTMVPGMTECLPGAGATAKQNVKKRPVLTMKLFQLKWLKKQFAWKKETRYKTRHLENHWFNRNQLVCLKVMLQKTLQNHTEIHQDQVSLAGPQPVEPSWFGGTGHPSWFESESHFPGCCYYIYRIV